VSRVLATKFSRSRTDCADEVFPLCALALRPLSRVLRPYIGLCLNDL